MTNTPIQTVLTGDIVKSTQMAPGQLDAVFVALDEAAVGLQNWQADPKLTRFRGDGWQMLVPDPRFMFRAALMARAAVKSVAKTCDTRISIGLGDAQTNGPELSNATGEAFVLSGRGLDDMRSSESFRITGSTSAVLPLLQAISDGWTAKQSEIAFKMLTNLEMLSIGDVADQLGISRSPARRQMQAARIDEVLDCLTILETSEILPTATVPLFWG